MDARTAEPPAEFDEFEVVLLRSAPGAEELDEAAGELLQRQHLGHFADMHEAGYLKVAGPLREQPDDSWRGICIYQVGSVGEARRLAELDPAVRAGHLTLDVMKWLTRKGALSFRE